MTCTYFCKIYPLIPMIQCIACHNEASKQSVCTWRYGHDVLVRVASAHGTDTVQAGGGDNRVGL